MGQLTGTVVTFVWMFGASFLTLMVIKAVVGLRASEQEEDEGMDVEECGMSAYPEFTGKGK